MRRPVGDEELQTQQAGRADSKRGSPLLGCQDVHEERGCVSMKGKLISKLLENRKIVRTGCGLMAAVVLLSGGMYIYDTQNSSEWALPVIVEGDGVSIEDEEVPLGTAPDVKTTKKTKTTRKKVKLKKANKKTYTKKLATKVKTKTKTQKKSDRTIKTVTKTTTATTEQYKKKQKFKTVITKVTTETTVTTTMKATKTPSTTKPATGTTTTPSTTKPATGTTTPSGGTSTTVVQKTLSDSDLIMATPKVDANVRNAFIQLGFSVKIDSTVGYSGLFSAKSKSITMRKENDDAIYHELGHFLMFTYVQNTDNDGGAKGKMAYAQEKSLYTGFNSAYVNQDASEYMAESYRDYCTDPVKLQSERPKTYELIKEAVEGVTDAKVAKFKAIYGW